VSPVHAAALPLGLAILLAQAGAGRGEDPERALAEARRATLAWIRAAPGADEAAARERVERATAGAPPEVAAVAAWDAGALAWARETDAWIEDAADEGATLAVAELGELLDALEAREAGWIWLDRLGSFAHRLGRDAAAPGLVERVRAVARRVGDRALASWAADWLGQDLWRRGRLGEAALRFEEAQAVETARGHPDRVLELAADRARVLGLAGDFAAAVRVLAEAEAAAPPAEPALLRPLLEARAGMHLDWGEHRRALAVLLRASPPGAAVPVDPAQVRLDLLAAGALSDLGDLEAADPFARRALELAERAEVARLAPLLAHEARLVLGLLRGDQGRVEEALAILERERDGQRAIRDPRGEAWAEKNLGWVLLDAGRLEEAGAAFGRADGLAARTEDPALAALVALGAAETAMRRAEAAGPAAAADPALAVAIERAETLAATAVDPELRWRAATLEGDRHRLAGRDAEALAAYRRAARAVEAWRARLESPGLVVHALRRHADPYRRGAFAAARLGRADEALELARLLQARVLEGLRAAAPLERAGRGESDAAGEALAAARRRLRSLEGAAGAATEAELDAARLALEHALVAHELARGALPGSAALAQPGPALVGGSDLDAVLVWLVGGEETLWLCVEPGGVRAGFAPLGEAELTRAVERLVAPIERLRRGAVDLAHLDLDAAPARALYDALLAPAVGELAPGARLGLIPDGPLASLPFALLVEDGEPGSWDPARPGAELASLAFFGERHAFARLSSLEALAREPAPRADGALRVALFLDGAASGFAGESEARSVRRAAPGFAVDVRRESTPEDLAGGASGLDVLHVVGHGRLDPLRPAESALVLAGRPLPSWRVEELALDASLVVLSACDGAGGSWRTGEGLLGLARSFLIAGAGRVLGSVLPVEDASAAPFLAAFYGALASGRDPEEALRRARVALLRPSGAQAGGPVLAHPLHWAGWTLVR